MFSALGTHVRLPGCFGTATGPDPVQEPCHKRGEAKDLCLKDWARKKKEIQNCQRQLGRLWGSAVLETQNNLFFCYTLAFLGWFCIGNLLCFSGGGAERGGGGWWKRRDHWSIHTYYHCAAPPPQSQPATACGGNHGKSSGRYGLINGGNISVLGVRVHSLVLDTHSVGEDAVYRSLFSYWSGKNFLALCLKSDMMGLVCSQIHSQHLLE